jgi:AcrR family transcriptional regulator
MNAETLQPASARPYVSALRDEQAELTRNKILAAFAEQIVDSRRHDFSIALVARRAGVSPRTVYVHFPNREVLSEALDDWLNRQVGAEPIPFPDALDGLPAVVRAVFPRFDRSETMIRAQLLTAVGKDLRSVSRSRRREALGRMVDEAAPSLPESERRAAAAVLHYLVSSEAWRSLKDESGLDGQESGAAVAHALGALIDDLKRRQQAITGEALQ